MTILESSITILQRPEDNTKTDKKALKHKEVISLLTRRRKKMHFWQYYTKLIIMFYSKIKIMFYYLNFIRITEHFPKLLHTQKEKLSVWLLNIDGTQEEMLY